MSKRLICCVGLPGCGKTTWAEVERSADPKRISVVNKDDIRAHLTAGGWKWSKENERDVVKMRNSMIRSAFAQGCHTVISTDTNFGGHLSDLGRMASENAWLFEVKDFRDVPPWVCAERNAKRGYTVPEKVIWDMAEKYLTPEQLVPGRKSPQLFVDLDGVLADFDGFIAKEFGIDNNRDNERPDFWDIVGAYRGDLYNDMHPTDYGRELWDALLRYNPVILSGAPFGHIPKSGQQKREWVRRFIDPTARVITCKSRNKSNYLQKGDILLDDWGKYRSLWEGKGGVFVLHTDPKKSIEDIRRLLS